MKRRRTIRLTLVCLVALCGEGAAWADSQDVPPSWRSGPKPKRSKSHEPASLFDVDDEPKDQQPWYVPELALGIGLNLPEIFPFEGYAFFGKYVALRLFYTPAMPINIRIEMPSDVISTKRGVGVAHPDFTIRLKATYGAQYGAETLVFPFGRSFFLMAGVSRRSMRVVGDTKSPVLVCSLIEAAKDPPCGDAGAAIETSTEIELKADVQTDALLTRAGLGWFWHIGSSGYFMFNAGATKPTRVTRKIEVEAGLDTPSEADEEIVGALAEIKAEREVDLESKAVAAMRPVDEKLLPIIGIAAGVRF